MRNNTSLDGYIARMDELKAVGGNSTSLLGFTVACTNGKGEYENTVFLDCTAWGKTGEMVNQYFSKGKPICVTGELKQENWEDKESGKKRSKIVLNVNRVDFPIGKANDGGSNTSAPAVAKMATDEIPF